VATTPDHAASLDGADAPAAPGRLEPAQCAVARCADLVCGKWTLLVVRDLATGPKSYSELESSLAGISPRTLCQRLRQLAEAGMLTRTRITGLPPRTLYELTESGFGLVPIVEAMRTVGEQMPTRQVPIDDASGADCCS
jgi:DNA-binding HxlR family transcriptional regulator